MYSTLQAHLQSNSSERCRGTNGHESKAAKHIGTYPHNTWGYWVCICCWHKSLGRRGEGIKLVKNNNKSNISNIRIYEQRGMKKIIRRCRSCVRRSGLLLHNKVGDSYCRWGWLGTRQGSGFSCLLFSSSSTSNQLSCPNTVIVGWTGRLHFFLFLYPVLLLNMLLCWTPANVQFAGRSIWLLGGFASFHCTWTTIYVRIPSMAIRWSRFK